MPDPAPADSPEREPVDHRAHAEQLLSEAADAARQIVDPHPRAAVLMLAAQAHHAFAGCATGSPVVDSALHDRPAPWAVDPDDDEAILDAKGDTVVDLCDAALAALFVRLVNTGGGR